MHSCHPGDFAYAAWRFLPCDLNPSTSETHWITPTHEWVPLLPVKAQPPAVQSCSDCEILRVEVSPNVFFVPFVPVPACRAIVFTLPFQPLTLTARQIQLLDETHPPAIMQIWPYFFGTDHRILFLFVGQRLPNCAHIRMECPATLSFNCPLLMD